MFHSGRGHETASCAEQEEDIGSPSDSESESPSPSTSRGSAGSSSLSELNDDDDDATSSSCGSGPDRFEMSDLMTQLPFKRGLSRFFDGKSQSFASLAAVGSLEDLPKPAARKRLKPSRSCGGALDAHRGRLLSPRRHCAKPASRKAARSGALSVLAVAAVAPRMPTTTTTPVVARPEGVAAKVLIVN